MSVDTRIGLLPAAGLGSRLGPIPCSKEIMPLGFRSAARPDGTVDWQPVTAIETHLEALRLAGAERAGIIISGAKPDIMRYLGHGERYGLPLVYLFQEQMRGMPFALDLAAPWLGEATVLFAMPDTLITPPDTMARLAGAHEAAAADVTLGLFATTTPQKFGMVVFDDAGHVAAFVDKPTSTDLTQMWGCAAWSGRFTSFMSRFLRQLPAGSAECVLSDVFQAALQAGLSFAAYARPGGHYHDIGTPASFQAAVYELALQQANETAG